MIDPDNGVGTDYTSLSAWEDYIDNTPDLTAGDGLIVKANCRSSSGTDDTTAATFGGMTSSATCYVWINGTDFPASTGVYDGTKYVLNTGENTNAITANEEYMVCTQIQFLVTSSGTGTARGWIVSSVGTSVHRLSNCIFNGSSSGTGASAGVRIADSSCTAYLFNCLVYGFLSGTDTGFIGLSLDGAALIAWNCTVSANYYGCQRASGTMTVINTACFNNADDWLGTITTDYCASDDCDASTHTNDVDISPTAPADEAGDWAAAMPDYATGNFAIGSSSSVLYNAGTADPGGADQDDDDIIGTARPQSTSWDIGAFELVVAAPPASVGQVIFVNEDGS